MARIFIGRCRSGSLSLDFTNKRNHAATNDVRTPKEFKASHIPGALNLDFNSPDFDKKVSQLDTNKTYLVHCAAGGRSAKACKKMEALGFKELFDLRPGFTGWEQAGKAIEK